MFILESDPESLMQALEELDYLAALDNDGNLSEMGIIMSELPLEPQMAKTMLASCEFDCVSEVVIIAAMLAGISPSPVRIQGVLSKSHFYVAFSSTKLHLHSTGAAETCSDPVSREIPAPRRGPLHPYQHLQGL